MEERPVDEGNGRPDDGRETVEDSRQETKKPVIQPFLIATAGFILPGMTILLRKEVQN